MASVSVKDVILTRRLAHLATNSLSQIPGHATAPKPLTNAEINAAARMLHGLTEVVGRAAVATEARQGDTR